MECVQQHVPVVISPQLHKKGTALSTTEILSHLDVAQMGEKFSMEIVNIADVSGGLTEERRKDIKKNLFEKHTLECVQLENELRSNEIKVFGQWADLLIICVLDV